MRVRFFFTSLIFLFIIVSCSKGKYELLSKNLEEIIESSISPEQGYSYLITKGKDTILNRRFGNDSTRISCFNKAKEHKSCSHQVFYKHKNKSSVKVNICTENSNQGHMLVNQDSISDIIFFKFFQARKNKNHSIYRFGE